MNTYERYADLRPRTFRPSRSRAFAMVMEPTFRKLYAPYLPAKKDARILDMGSGNGEFLYLMQRAGYESATGVDLDPKHVEEGRAAGVRNLACGDARSMLRDSLGQFDFISSINMLEHFPKDQLLELLKLIGTALRPGGRFLCQVPNAATFFLPLFFMDFTHETPFAPTSLKQVLEMTGFVNVRVGGVRPVVHGVKSAVRFVLWKLIEAGLSFIQLVEQGPTNDLCRIFTANIFAVADKKADAANA
ncbi:MAG: class I SAM-dependent methyltransferase [Terriglobia bacterium]